MAMISSDLKIVEFSPGLIDFQKTALNSAPTAGQSLAESWLDSEGEAAVRSALKTGKAATEVITYPPGSFRPIIFDFHILTFSQANLRLGVFNIHMSSVRSLNSVVSDSSMGPLFEAAPRTETPEIVGSFLFDTLLAKKRLMQRKGYGYLAVRAWRKPIKTYQIAALKALKKGPSDSFVERIADELNDAIKSVHGNLKNAIVVPIPCGHSGPGCLSEKIAAALAKRIGVPMVRAFEPIEVSGSSHPKTNAKRPKMKLREAPLGQVILVDDVATSGAHIEEARILLSETASAVWSIAWIAD